jgi:hypothetical protein
MFTSLNNEIVEKDIGQDVQSIVSAIKNSVLNFEAIYLVGSFGRGEGTVRFDGSRWRGINDYDVLVIPSTDLVDLNPLKELGLELAKTLQIDFVDIGYLPKSVLSSLTPTLENYDLKYASTFLGGRDLLGEIPNFDSQDISPYEFARLICNRTAGLLSARLPRRMDSVQYRTNQYVKACIAIGDVAVYLGRGYNPSYRKRMDTFKSIAQERQINFALPEHAVDCIIEGYARKLGDDPTVAFDVDETSMRNMIENSFCAIAERCVGKPLTSIGMAENSLVKYYTRKRGLLKAMDNILCARLHKDRGRGPDITNRILFSLPAFYCHLSGFDLHCELEYLRKFWCIPGALKKNWNSLSAVMLWEEYCH